MKLLSEHACFGGTQRFLAHDSRECGAEMRFSVYEPPQAKRGRVPVLYYLAGLTCTEETIMIKAGAQRLAAEHGLMLVAPDTSPRVRLPGDDAGWDFGLAAGFYVDATQAPWSAHYRMYSYVTRELPRIIGAEFAANPSRQGIFGHSMGGHGALVCALRNPDQYRSVSAFAPIAAPVQCPWGRKAFSGYLGTHRAGLAGVRRQCTCRRASVPQYDPDRPGLGRSFPDRAAETGRLRRGLPPFGPGLRPAHAGGLRPRLLLHPDVHAGPHRLPCSLVVSCLSGNTLGRASTTSGIDHVSRSMKG